MEGVPNMFGENGKDFRIKNLSYLMKTLELECKRYEKSDPRLASIFGAAMTAIRMLTKRCIFLNAAMNGELTNNIEQFMGGDDCCGK